MAELIVLKFCQRVGHIKYHSLRMTVNPQMGVVGVGVTVTHLKKMGPSISLEWAKLSTLVIILILRSTIACTID